VRNAVDWWGRVETRELLNPRINYFQGEIKGDGRLFIVERKSKGGCCKAEAEKQKICVGQEK